MNWEVGTGELGSEMTELGSGIRKLKSGMS